MSNLSGSPHSPNEANQTGLPGWLRIVIIGHNPRRTLIRAAVLAVSILVVAKFVLLPRRVSGPSMLPTYHEGSVNFVNRLAYVLHDPQRGDVVFVRLAGFSLMYMKRVVGLPGEKVAFLGGRLMINGQILDEPYVKRPCYWNSEPRQLGPNEYFVVGDNRSMRIEDHEMGVAMRRRIVGKALL